MRPKGNSSGATTFTKNVEVASRSLRAEQQGEESSFKQRKEIKSKPRRGLVTKITFQ
jgi:hypothetical protein